MPVEKEYSEDELSQLRSSARCLLGWEVEFHNLHIGGETAPEIAEKVIDTRGKARIAISEITFYPTQSPAWQKKVEKDRLTGEQVARRPMQIYSDFNSANPLVSVVLQRGMRAKSDPLAVIKRVVAVFGRGSAEEMTWKKLLTHRAIGLKSAELPAMMNAINFAPVLDESSPVQLRRIPGIAAFDDERREPGESAHADQDSSLTLTDDAKTVLSRTLERLSREAQ